MLLRGNYQERFDRPTQQFPIFLSQNVYPQRESPSVTRGAFQTILRITSVYGLTRLSVSSTWRLRLQPDQFP